MASTDDYVALITSEHRDRPKFAAAVALSVSGFVDQINLLEAVPARFDVDVAVGEQLDFVGQWVGQDRRLREPIDNVYFAFDDPDVGLDAGFLKGEEDPATGVIVLDDATYRLLLYLQIAANVWDGSTQEAERILATAFAGSMGTHIFIQDNADMSIDIGISGTMPSALLLALLQNGYFGLKPAGVRINNVFVNPGPFFGFDNENYNISGLDVGVFT